MSAAQALASYKRVIGKLGMPVAIGRYSSGPSRVRTDTVTQAYVRNYESKELVGAIVQGDQVAIALVDTLTGLLPITTSDKLIVNGKEYAIKNPMKRIVSGELIALEIHAAG